ncbi:uncharacterized protein DFL_003249 [Arthrobotrys flagrans]|uniref:Uncharacterized protein n=1 Tax=Arthrobotrys flagrans TaxID=97331 RepID=A0A437A1A0_ARTFL|nr:hypothetical protein DFL_003249 [Arthrobotrys flagrans]
MSPKSKTELAALAGSSVYTANHLLSGISARHHGETGVATEHYLRAATGAAIAFTAYEILQMEKEKERKRKRKRYKEIGYEDEDEQGHNRRMLERAAGAYALGKEPTGDKRHKGRHRAAEILGAIGLSKEAKRHRD